jgi:hypothetical protein
MKELLNLNENEILYLLGKKNSDKLKYILNSKSIVKKDIKLKNEIKIKQLKIQHSLNDF